jgi:ketosteroid isomerase-like protein
MALLPVVRCRPERDSSLIASTNLQLIRSLYRAWERGDRSSIDWADPEIEFVIADGPAPGRWTGHAAMAQGFRELLRGWQEWRPRADEYIELSDERVLVLDHFTARGKASGMEVGHVRTEGAVLFHLREGKATRVTVYWDRSRALADLGFTPGSGSQGS